MNPTPPPIPSTPNDPLPALPARDSAGHKGTFGTVTIFGGCATGDARMIGAPALAAISALRSGAGLAKLVAPEPILDSAITIAPSATGRALPVDVAGRIIAHESVAVLDEVARTSDCLVVGPGLGLGEGPAAISLRAIQQEDTPVVIDADAINNLAQIPDLAQDFHAAAVLTPHPGEYRRLAQALNLSQDPVDQATRLTAATALAQRLGCIVALKGPNTVVSDGQRTWTNDSGHHCLATAGTGDVLAGIIAGLTAQFVALQIHPKIPLPPNKPLDLFDATRLAVHAHGLAAQRWAQSHDAESGMLAFELADLIPEALASLN